MLTIERSFDKECFISLGPLFNFSHISVIFETKQISNICTGRAAHKLPFQQKFESICISSQKILDWWKYSKNFIKNRLFFTFRELYLCKDKRKDPGSFTMDGSRLDLLSVKISFILVKPQESYSRDRNRYDLSKIIGIRSQDHYPGNNSLVAWPKGMKFSWMVDLAIVHLYWKFHSF